MLSGLIIDVIIKRVVIALKFLVVDNTQLSLSQGEYRLDWEFLRSIPWEIIDVFLSFLELLIICVPATVLFVYYKFKSISAWVIETTSVGARILIHNKTNRSIFLKDISFETTKCSGLSNPVVAFNQEIKQLKPDDYIIIVVNYRKTAANSQAFRLHIKYDHKKQKSIKVVVK